MSQSGFAENDLETVLKLIRQISQMPDVEALAALDGLLKQIGLAAAPVVQVSTTEDSWRQRQFEDFEVRLNKEVEKLRAGIRDPAILAPWQPTTIRQQADQLDQWLGSDLTGKYAMRVAELRATVVKLASEAEYVLVRRSADEALTRPIHSTASARSILAAVDENRQQFIRLGRLTADVDAGLRKAKERAAWYRSRKCLDDAEVASAGGNTKKATKLRAEAAVVLRQDWNEAFPEEPPPVIPPATVA